MKTIRTIRTVLIWGAITLIALPGLAKAQAPKTLTVEPFLQDVSIKPNVDQTNFVINVLNNTSTNYTFQAKAADFGSLDETGGVLFAGGQSEELIKKYGLSKWIVIKNPNHNIKAGQRIRLNIAVENRPDLTPGGHYAAIVLTNIRGQTGLTKPQVSLQKNISSLVFAKNLTGANYKLELTSFTDNQSLLTTASEVTLKFKNSGNTHIVPRGEVKIIGPFGKQIGKGIINTESSIVLPETERLIAVKIFSTGNAFLPGFYKTEVSYRYDGQDKTAQTTPLSHFYIGWPLTIMLLALLVWTVRRAIRAR